MNKKNNKNKKKALFITMTEDDKKLLASMGYDAVNFKNRARNISNIKFFKNYKKIYIISDEIDMLIHDGYYWNIYDDFLKELSLLDNEIVILSLDKEHSSITDMIKKLKNNIEKEKDIEKLIAKGRKIDKSKIFKEFKIDIEEILKNM